jgi:MFS family permease
MEKGYQMDRTISMETVDFTDQTGNNDTIFIVNSHPRTSQLSNSIFSPVVALPIIVFIDMFAVALVVPLLFQYYKLAGVTSATRRELLSSVFSVSQIVGGLLLGALTDARILQRKTLLFVSFGGSALSYLMITYGGFTALILSRILVGMVKQTMTVTTSMLSQYTTEDDRAKHMGRLESSMTAAWILGPSAGALLFKCTLLRMHLSAGGSF